MNLADTIKDNFNKGYFNKAMLIEGINSEYPAWTIKQDKYVGVFVPYFRKEDFSEYFSSVRIRTFRNVDVDGTEYDVLMLTCSDMNLRNEFALICSQFAEPGNNGKERDFLINNPEEWWKRWKTLLGNVTSNTETYSLIGELTALEYLMKNNIPARWSGVEKGTHDIETPDNSYEVKSTIARYGYEVTISSIYQMKKSGETLDLIFCRFEQSGLGRSLDDLIDSLVKLGVSENDIEKHMQARSLEKGCTARNIKYKLLEMKSYPVNDDFPVITEHSFKGDKLPPNILKFKYTVDLSGLSCTNLL